MQLLDPSHRKCVGHGSHAPFLASDCVRARTRNYGASSCPSQIGPRTRLDLCGARTAFCAHTPNTRAPLIASKMHAIGVKGKD